MWFDRLLYSLGLVRRSHYKRLQGAALNLISQQIVLRDKMNEFERKFCEPTPPPEKPKSHLKVIK